MKKLTTHERMDLLNFITDEKMARQKSFDTAERTGEGNVAFELRKLQNWMFIQNLRRNPSPKGGEIVQEICAEWEAMGISFGEKKGRDFWNHCKVHGMATPPEKGKSGISFSV